jgi:hypothetical protein
MRPQAPATTRSALLVYLNVTRVVRGYGRADGYRACWYSLTTREPVYRSTVALSLAKAEALAHKFKERTAWCAVPPPINTPSEATPYALRKIAATLPLGTSARRALYMAAECIERLVGNELLEVALDVKEAPCE